jgi:GNAT superfamily N-acetyltransferase
MSEVTVDAKDGAITVVPANEASLDDLTTVFGNRGEAHNCQCQWFKTTSEEWRAMPIEQRASLLQAQTNCGNPDATSTTGLIAYLDAEPVGWCAVEPRPVFVQRLGKRVVWSGRDEDPADEGVWAVTCFVTRTGFRRRGVSRALAAATVDFARARGARAVEGYPMEPPPGREITWGELFVGSRSIFEDAGYAIVSRPTLRRLVMRIDF